MRARDGRALRGADLRASRRQGRDHARRAPARMDRRQLLRAGREARGPARARRRLSAADPYRGRRRGETDAQAWRADDGHHVPKRRVARYLHRAPIAQTPARCLRRRPGCEHARQARRAHRISVARREPGRLGDTRDLDGRRTRGGGDDGPLRRRRPRGGAGLPGRRGEPHRQHPARRRGEGGTAATGAG